MKEFIVNTYCDECSREGRQEPATTTPAISLGAAKPRTLDLCETHDKELLGALRDVLERDGVRVQESAPAKKKKSGRKVTNKTPGPFACQVPDCPGLRGARGPAYPFLGSLKNHVTYAHKLTWPEYVAQYGEPEALAEDASGSTTPEPDPEPLWSEPEGTEAAPKVFECGIGDCTYTSWRSQAAGAHRAHVHGIPGTSKKAKRRQQQKSA